MNRDYDNYYSPDNWVVLQIVNEDKTLYKVLAGWSGSYLEGSSWRLNSGIVSCTEDGDYYVFKGYSGSCYYCNKETNFLKMNIGNIYEALKNKHGANVELMPQDIDWLNFDFNLTPNQ
jgi:hypothetical protein